MSKLQSTNQNPMEWGPEPGVYPFPQMIVEHKMWESLIQPPIVCPVHRQKKFNIILPMLYFPPRKFSLRHIWDIVNLRDKTIHRLAEFYTDRVLLVLQKIKYQVFYFSVAPECCVSIFVHKYQKSNSWTIKIFFPQELNVVPNNFFSEKYSLSTR